MFRSCFARVLPGAAGPGDGLSALPDRFGWAADFPFLDFFFFCLVLLVGGCRDGFSDIVSDPADPILGRPKYDFVFVDRRPTQNKDLVVVTHGHRDPHRVERELADAKISEMT